MKKITKLFTELLTVSFLSLVFFGCPNPTLSDPPKEVISSVTPKKIVVNGLVMNCGIKNSIPYKVEYNPLTFINSSNKKYNKTISKLCSAISMDAYDAVSVVDKEVNYKESGAENDRYFAELLGFTDVKRYDLKSSYYDVDKNDLTSAIFSHQIYNVNDTNYEIILAVFQGTDGSKEQWISNFDIGADTEEYTKATGEHSEWKTKENAKGFDVAANRIDAKLTEYIASNCKRTTQKIIILTGHSRGAAIANILGAKYENNKKYKSFTYCYATPRVTTAENYADYETIFNVINRDDLIVNLPMDGEGFGFNPYGTVKAVSVKTAKRQDEKTYKQLWEEFVKGTDETDPVIEYVSADGASNKVLFEAICASRADLYKFDEDLTYSVNFNVINCPSLEDYLKAIDENNLTGLIDNPVKLTEGTYRFSYCPAAYITILAQSIPAGANALSLMGMYSFTAKYSDITTMMFSNVEGIACSHAQETYLLLADNLDN